MRSFSLIYDVILFTKFLVCHSLCNKSQTNWPGQLIHDKRYPQFSTDTKQFRKHGILYKKSVLSKENFDCIKMELDHMSQCSQLKVVKETKNSVARGRWGSIIPFSSKIACILSDNNGEISHLINNITESGSSWSFSNMVPIELRIYNERGAGEFTLLTFSFFNRIDVNSK